LHFACIGVLMPHKGAHVAIEALRLARLDAARLTLFGVPTHPYFGRLLRAAEQVENLEFRGYGAFEPSELRLLLSDVDAVIIPSLVWESYSIAAREALACGVPVLASRSGALPEAIRHGGNGLLFTPGHASGLAAFIRTLAADPAALAALRDGIRPDDWISVPQRIGALEAVLGEVTAGRSLGSPRATELDELSVLREVLVERS
jgi:glycosyltransferase involved in cell wall biosynthesis